MSTPGVGTNGILDLTDTAVPDDLVYRCRELDDTLDRLWRTRTDYGVSRVGDLTDLDHFGLPVFVAVRPDGHPRNLTVSNGKGMTRKAALVSALAEAYERHWAEPTRHDFRVASARELADLGEAFVSPTDLGVRLGAAWTPDDRLEWLSFRDLVSGDSAWVAADYAVVPYAPPGRPLLGPSASDGIAAGNSFDEAVLHGLLELIERDGCSFGLWTAAGHRIKADTIPTFLRPVVERFEQAGVEVSMYQFDSAVDIPVHYVTVVDSTSRNPMLICAGAGAHLDGTISLTRALTEAAQTRVCAISGGREDLEPKYAHQRGRGFTAAREALERWSSPLAWTDFRRWGGVALREDIVGTTRALVEALASAGMKHVYARRLSPEDGPLTVAAVVVPGLELVEDRHSPAGDRFRRALLAHVEGMSRG